MLYTSSLEIVWANWHKQSKLLRPSSFDWGFGSFLSASPLWNNEHGPQTKSPNEKKTKFAKVAHNQCFQSKFWKNDAHISELWINRRYFTQKCLSCWQNHWLMCLYENFTYSWVSYFGFSLYMHEISRKNNTTVSYLLLSHQIHRYFGKCRLLHIISLITNQYWQTIMFTLLF